MGGDETRGARWLRVIREKYGQKFAARKEEYLSFWSDPEASCDPRDVEQIEKDLSRTFSSQEWVTPQFIQRLRRVLTVVAVHQGGYLQSMNFVVGMVLHTLHEDGVSDDVREQVGYCFSMTLFTSVLPGLHMPDMCGEVHRHIKSMSG